MKINYVVGDLIDGDELLIAHGCNARGVYASGIAGAIRKRLPFAYDAYRAAFDDSTMDFELGRVIWGFNLQGKTSRIVGNMITQDDFGRVPGRVYVSYAAVTRALQDVNRFVAWTQDKTIDLSTGPITTVGFPLLGCGLGGGSWTRVAQLIEQESQCFQPVVYTLDGVIPDD